MILNILHPFLSEHHIVDISKQPARSLSTIAGLAGCWEGLALYFGNSDWGATIVNVFGHFMRTVDVSLIFFLLKKCVF